MKKLKTFLVLWLMALTLGYSLTSCDKEDMDIPGSITMKMRNKSNGGNSIYWNNSRAYLYINESNNFFATDWYSAALEPSCIASVGKVKGLGSIKKIPESGWTHEISVIVGHGYVVRWIDNVTTQHSYARIFVQDEIVSTTGGIIGYTISYIEGM